ncbi:hypothetical protein [Lysinibacillus fusiformis]|uniref:hypothetical protein n=1 Tax=Lysinibacillus fusiformis TaxID=28031 RepID=UPI00301675F1
MVVLDGGYYAIKGFNFQYDYTLLKLLENEDEEQIMEIEITEDLGDSSSYIQVKYKERTNYTPSSLKKPVLQLMELYKRDKRSPILYAHFNDKGEEEWQPNKTELDVIIGNCNVKAKEYIIDETLKEDFLANFKIIFTNKYQDQFEKLIDVIIKKFKCDEDIALIYYAQMYKYVERKVIDNPPENKENRVCTKKELYSLIQIRNKQMFYFSYSDFLGKKKYYQLINKLHFREFNRENRERIFIIECNKDSTVQILFDLTNKIRDKFYSMKTIKKNKILISPAPYILFYNSDLEILKELKKQLVNSNFLLKDGFNFENADFNLQSLVERGGLNDFVQIKFINNINHLAEVITILNSPNLSVFNFYVNSDEVPASIENTNGDFFNYSKFQMDELTDLIEHLF